MIRFDVRFPRQNKKKKIENFSAAGERRTANNGDVAGDVVGGRPESWRPLTVVDGDDDRRRGGSRLRWGEHPRGGCHGTRLLRERQAHDDRSSHRPICVQLSVRQRGEASFGSVSKASTDRDLLLVVSHADTLHHRPRTLS